MKKSEAQAYCPAEHDQKLIFEIGRITAKHAMLEALITDLIAYILKIMPNQGVAVSMHLGLKAKIDMAKSLAHETPIDKKERGFILKVLSDVEKASKKRNEFTHRLIGYAGSETSELHSYNRSARGTAVKETRTKVTPEAARSVADSIGGVNLNLVRIVIGDTPWQQKT